MRVLVQNLQKRSSLAADLVDEKKPDLLLAQEINLHSETRLDPSRLVEFASKRGYGTAIYSNKAGALTDVKKVPSPHPEFGGFITKKTVIATVADTNVVSFHGYNGRPRCDASKLVDHVRAVADALDEESCVFAGDFNTWTTYHVAAVEECLIQAGFAPAAYSWPYPGRSVPLDHVFLRGKWRVASATDYACASDHRGAIIELEDGTSR